MASTPCPFAFGSLSAENLPLAKWLHPYGSSFPSYFFWAWAFVKCPQHTGVQAGELRVQLAQAKSQIAQLQQELEAMEAEKDAQRLCPWGHIVDEVRLALRKYTALYDLFPPLNKDFYEQERPEDNAYATSYQVRYENSTSASLGTLLDLYSVFPGDKASETITASEPFLDMVCICVI